MKCVPSQVVDMIEDVWPPDKFSYDTDERFVVARDQHGGAVDAVLTMVDMVPSNLLRGEPSEVASFVRALSELKHARTQWPMRGGRVPGIRQRGVKRNPIAVIHDFLADCPDTSPDTIHTLAFITDEDLRRDLASDLGVIESALRNSEWKAATVLGGALIEALLLWKMTQTVDDDVLLSAKRRVVDETPLLKKALNERIDTWGLLALVAVARQLGILDEEAQGVISSARKYRNLIHPGRAQRLGVSCSRGTATATLGAVHLVLEALRDDGGGESSLG